MTTTHETATQQPDHSPRETWHPVLGEWLPFREVWGYDPDDPVDDDSDPPPASEIDRIIAEDRAAAARAVLEAGVLLIAAEAVRRDRAFRARPAAVRRALTIRHRRAVRRARRHHRLAAGSSR